PDATTADQARPYPFFLCHPLTTPPASLGPRDDWQVEWKWDGIRAQLVRREADIALWSRGEALITERFPEVVEAAGTLPAGVVLDGELLAWQDEVLPFAALQRRLGRKTLTPRLLREVPVILLVYDLLEQAGEDIRPLPLQVRRARLADLLTDAPPALRLSPRIEAPDWPALAKLREQSRARRVEGFMLKRHDSPYRAGRRKGEWWKWKIAPHTLDAVLTHAQPGAGRRSNLYTDYTFAVWDEQDRLVPIAKAYSGLTDMEIAELDAWIRQHTRERFGPVRAVEPQLVFELAFEGLAPSRRHKSGIAVRFPRILRWRRDLDAQDADRLADIRQLIGT
ncbi:MAG TPA: cisplatin damage response ATP-dependent DNA ligase, partial [Gammaproteobacteria bacterium]|nr:cisplatin damage response ATP-dependent DNA ligase [Gammaproteobacteria bacterium]